MSTQTNEIGPRLLLRVPEAAQLLGIGRSTLYELIAAGEIPVVHVGRAVRVRADAVKAWVERQQPVEVE